MFCKFCGKEIEDNSKFCAACGKELNHEEQIVFTTEEPVNSDTYSKPAFEADKPIVTFAEETKKPGSDNALLENMVMMKKIADNKKATTSLTLGIISLVAWLLPLFGYPVSIIGLVMGVKGSNSDKKGTATAGMVLSCIGLIATLINSILGILQKI